MSSGPYQLLYISEKSCLSQHGSFIQGWDKYQWQSRTDFRGMQHRQAEHPMHTCTSIACPGSSCGKGMLFTEQALESSPALYTHTGRWISCGGSSSATEFLATLENWCKRYYWNGLWASVWEEWELYIQIHKGHKLKKKISNFVMCKATTDWQLK